MQDVSFVTNPEMGTLLAFVAISAVWLGIVALLGAIFNPRVKDLGEQIFASTLLASGLAGIMVFVFILFTARSFGDGASGCFLGFTWWVCAMLLSHFPACFVADHRELVALKQKRVFDQSHGV
jgi:hypothetical protein